ncbi:unnamed protein product [Rhizophagus irregularis]|nr:unnamed protein product [Rhizophagus irregularis]
MPSAISVLCQIKSEGLDGGFVNDYALISRKCMFENKDMYVMVSTAFKIELIKDEIPSTGLYISFVRKVYSKPKQDDNGCVFGVNVTEYNNNFSFANK